MPPALLDKTTCPHCWHEFEPHDVLWVAAHPSLRGDSRLGDDAHRRFLPSRFVPGGGARDEAGAECTQLACPRCHLPVPRICLELRPWFASVFGAPACGKSYFLGAMTWALRRRLPELFRVTFTDSDAAANQTLAGYEDSLFYNPNPDQLLLLGELIHKTKETGDLYNRSLFGGEWVSYPQPFLFTLRPQDGHPLAADPDAASRVVCLYDNAGESFAAGRDTATSPVTRHLAESALLMFLFDPTQHPPFRHRLAAGKADVASDDRPGAGASRQDLILTEAAGRVRRFARMRDTDRIDRPLVVVVTKKDLWAHLVPELTTGGPVLAATRDGAAALNLDRLREQSRAIRELLVRLTPEVVTAAEAFAASVTYVGVSALGTAPTRDPQSGKWAVRPAGLRPDAVELPLLFGLHQELPRLIPGGRRAAPGPREGRRP